MFTVWMTAADAGWGGAASENSSEEAEEVEERAGKWAMAAEVVANGLDRVDPSVTDTMKSRE